jgi:hypothetical protein
MRPSQRSMGGRAHPSAVAGRLTGARPAMPARAEPDQPVVPGSASDLSPGSQGPGELATERALFGGAPMPSPTGGGSKI